MTHSPAQGLKQPLSDSGVFNVAHGSPVPAGVRPVRTWRDERCRRWRSMRARCRSAAPEARCRRARAAADVRAHAELAQHAMVGRDLDFVGVVPTLSGSTHRRRSCNGRSMKAAWCRVRSVCGCGIRNHALVLSVVGIASTGASRLRSSADPITTRSRWKRIERDA